MKRVVEPEWLDELPVDDAGAVGSRRDLHRLNRIMGHCATLRGLLELGMRGQCPGRIIELGAGDGTLMLRLAGHFSRQWKAVEVVLVDCKGVVDPGTRAKFEALGWRVEVVVADIFDWLKQPGLMPADAMVANLFLHQFPDDRLRELLRLAAERTRVFVACEPRRGGMPFAFSRLVGLIGCNAVTRHDAPSSVRAGFAGRELSALWPAGGEWRLREGGAKLFSHAFLAERPRSRFNKKAGALTSGAGPTYNKQVSNHAISTDYAAYHA